MPLTYWNVLIFAAILVGARFHANKALHSRWMIGCFLADLALLATVEFVGRSAVGEAADRMFETGQDRTMTLVHVSLAVAGLVLWFPMILAGRRLLRGDESARGSHKRYLPWFLLCRLGNAVTAFFVV